MKPIGVLAAELVARAGMQGEPSRALWDRLLSPDHPKAPLVHAGATPVRVANYSAGLVYLATPYTREVLSGGKWSYEKSVTLSTLASRHMVMLMRERVTAISPIVMASEAMHAQCSVGGRRLDPLDQEFWSEWCRPLLHAARAVVVPNIPGWERSLGIWSEVAFALEHNMPVFVYAGGK